jgi:tetratricopeptide (TPR) repeat protein
MKTANQTTHMPTGRALVRSLALILPLGLFSCGIRNDIPGEPKDLIAQGWEYLTIQEFDRAEDSFRSASARSAKDTREYALGFYGMGCSAEFRRPEADIAGAKNWYRQAIEEDQTGEIAPWAALALARADFIDTAPRTVDVSVLADPDLREGYREVIRRYPGTPAATEAALHLAQSLFASEEAEEATEAVALLEGLLEKDPNTPYRYGIYASLGGHAYREERYLDQYHYMVKQAEAIRDEDRNKADFYYRIAYHADARLGRADLALPYYERIVEEYPVDGRSYQVRKAIERLRAESEE